MYKSFIKWALMTLSFLTLFGCHSEQPITKLPPVLMFEVYKPTGEVMAKKSITSSDLLHKHLTTLLLQEGVNWKSSVASYAGVRYVFRDKSLVVRCLADKIVIDIQDANGWKSYEKTHPNLLAELGLD
jgi:hypothetical protein